MFLPARSSSALFVYYNSFPLLESRKPLSGLQERKISTVEASPAMLHSKGNGVSLMLDMKMIRDDEYRSLEGLAPVAPLDGTGCLFNGFAWATVFERRRRCGLVGLCFC